jgi:AraC-like DNA-binding protein
MLAYTKHALNYIAQNYDQEISVDDIAAAVGISKAHLQRTFRQSEGCTIVEAINRLRLDKAKLLLEASYSSVVEVAHEVGFSSRQYFTDLFTRSVGVSPARYRKHQRGNMAAGFADADMGVEIDARIE